MSKCLLTLALFILKASVVFSQEIDNEFRPLVFQNPEITTSAVQLDGKVIVAGKLSSVNGINTGRIVRINLDGSLDETFSVAEMPWDASVFFLEPLPGGKLLAGGYRVSGDHNIVIFNTDGTVDPSFNESGEVGGVWNAVAIPNGQFFVWSTDLQIIRMNTDGTIDGSFQSGSGPDGAGIDDAAMAYQPDGKLLIGGSFHNFSGEAYHGLVRLNTDGSIDHAFNIGSGLPLGFTRVTSISVQDDGKILIAGRFSKFNGVTAKNVVRLNSDGSVDNTFSSTSGTELSEEIFDVVRYDDNFYLSGMKLASGEFQFRLLKIDDSGQLDNSFAIPSLNLMDALFISTSLDIHNNEIVFAGPFTRLNASPQGGLVKFDLDGNTITSFDPKVRDVGIVRTAAIQQDGKILIGGDFDYIETQVASNLGRLNDDGSADDLFLTALGEGFDRPVNVVKIQPDKKILVGGQFMNFQGVSTNPLIRIDEAGVKDNGFNAEAIHGIGAHGVKEIVLEAEGKMMVAGSLTTFGSQRNMIRLLSSGASDPSFNASIASNQIVMCMARRPNGNYLIGGEVTTTYTGFFYEMDSNGNIVDDFSSIDISNQSPLVIRVRPDNSFVFAGSFSSVFSDLEPNAVYQFDQNNLLIDKISVTVFAGNINDIQFTAGNRLLIGGNFRKINSVDHTGPAKVSADGSNLIFPIELTGDVTKFLRISNSDDNFLVLGSFKAINNISFRSIAKVNLSIPETPVLLPISADDAIGTVTASWIDQSDNETGFVILRSVNGGNLEPIDSVSFDITLYRDDDVVGSTIYNYSVKSFSVSYQSVLSNSEQVETGSWVAPNAPINLKLISKATISWTDASSNELKFHVERSVNGQPFQNISTIEQNQDSYSIQIEVETETKYRLKASNNFGESGYSNELTIPFLPASPSQLIVEQDDDAGSIKLDWTDNSAHESGFAIYLSTNGSAYLAIDSVTENTVTFDDKDPLPLNFYSYKIKAFSLHYESAFSNEASTSTASWIPPNAPKNLAHDPIVAPFNNVVLKWSDMSDNEIGFEIERSIASAEFSLASNANVNLQSTTEQFDFDKQYSYRIRAYNKFGKSEYSNTLLLPIVVGVSDDEGNEIRMFPNPATTWLNIELGSEQFTRCAFFSSDGRLTIDSDLAGRMTTIDVSALYPGLYFVRLANGSDSRTLKFFKK